ncbi:MAG TPA: phosphotransferase [Candidatus Limnocylindrales bacterium]
MWPAGPAPDLGGSSNLNLLVTDGLSLRVARVYRPFVTGQRVAAIQAVRHHLAGHGVPSVEPIQAAGGRGWEIFEGRAVEVEPYVAAPATMNTLTRVRTGLAVLGRIHALVRELPSDPAATSARFANYVAADDLVEAVGVGTRRIRAWQPTPAEARQPLWSNSVWVALLDDQDAARRHLAAIAPNSNGRCDSPTASLRSRTHSPEHEGSIRG